MSIVEQLKEVQEQLKEVKDDLIGLEVNLECYGITGKNEQELGKFLRQKVDEIHSVINRLV